jgi:hypothetical protein
MQISRFRNITRILSRLAVALAVALAATCYAPRLLAFPYQAQIGEITVRSVDPIGPEMPAILARAQQRLAASEIAAPLGPRTLYLTDGGWRWALLSLPRSQGAFAITRPLSTNIVVNRSDVAGDGVANNAAIGNRRTLSGTIAHETTHLLIFHRYGMLAPLRFANWKVEGYCDHVARESSLSDAQAKALRDAGKHPPALDYYEARWRVSARLAAGASIDRLLAE